MTSDKSDDLFPHLLNPEGTQIINDRCVLRTQDGYRVVLVSGMPLAHYAVGDDMSEAHAMVNLVDQGWADQNDVAKTFGCSVRTLRRQQRRFEEDGLPALGRARGYPRGQPRLSTKRQRAIQQLKSQGHSHYEMARRLGISVRAVRKTLRRLGWKPTPTVQPELPLDGVQTTPSSRDAAAAAVAAPSGSGGNPKLSAFYHFGKVASV